MQGATGRLAAVGDAGDHLLGDAHLELPRGEVVEEEQRLRPADDEVVDVHGHQVDADGVVASGEKSELQLRAHAVGARHQQGFAVTGGEGAQTREATEIGHDLGTHGAANVPLDAFHERVARVDVDTGVAIGQAGLVGCHRAVILRSRRPRRRPRGGWRRSC